MGFLDDLYQEHGQSVQERVSTELGIPADKAARALPTVAPIILAGLRRDMDNGGPAHIESIEVGTPGCPGAPSRIPACGFPAPGSSTELAGHPARNFED